MYEVIKEGVNLFNDYEFFASHDFFEALWMDADSEKKLFYQGMVQLSVGSYHLLNKNYKGALSQYNKGTTKLRNYLPSYMGIELEFLLQKINNMSSDLENYLSGEDVLIDINRIPKIEKI